MRLTILVIVGVIIGGAINLTVPDYMSINFRPDNMFEAPEPSPIPPATRVEAAETTPNIIKLVDYIWQAESCRGECNTKLSLQRYCEGRGMWNELGYGGMDLRKCFRNQKEGWGHVTDWIRRHLNKYDGDEARTLCRYNLGKSLNDCEYYQNYLYTNGI